MRVCARVCAGVPSTGQEVVRRLAEGVRPAIRQGDGHIEEVWRAVLNSYGFGAVEKSYGEATGVLKKLGASFRKSLCCLHRGLGLVAMGLRPFGRSMYIGNIARPLLRLCRTRLVFIDVYSLCHVLIESHASFCEEQEILSEGHASCTLSLTPGHFSVYFSQI